MRTKFGISLLFCLCSLGVKAQFSEKFTACSKNNLINCCWSFCGVEVNNFTQFTNGGCNARSNQLTSNNEANAYFQLPAVAVFAANAKLSFLHCMTNLSSTPNLIVKALNVTTNVSYTLATFPSSSFNGSAMRNSEISWPLGIGVFKITFCGTGNGGSSRFVIDDILLTNARQVASPALNCALVLAQTKVKDFTVKKSTSTLTAQWKTEGATYTKYEVEASAEGTVFQKVATTSAKLGENNNYQITIINNQNWKFFRLKASNSDGTCDFSNVVSIASESSEHTITCYPNPSNDGIFQIKTQKVISRCQIVNTYGTVVKDFVPTSNNLTLDLAGLSKGVYYVKLYLPNGKSLTQQVVYQ